MTSPLIHRAQQLAITYTDALSTHAQEIRELRQAAVPTSRVLSLYPYDEEDWKDGLTRLEGEIGIGGVPRLSEGEAQAARFLARRLLSSQARAFLSESAVRSCAQITRPSVAILDIEQYLHLLVVTLHLLAYASEAEDVLEGDLAQRLAESLLRAASAIATAPSFATSS